MIAIAIICGILAIGSGAAAYVYYHPQIIIGGIQKMLYRNGKPINSFEPFAPAMRRVKENGQLYVTEIQYGTDYPNSYLDITYPNEDTSASRPTIVYFHGGGFFGGDKSMGDPMAVDDDGICAAVMSGMVTVPCSGGTPALGWSGLSADGAGGVKADSAGQKYRVVDVDTAGKMLTFVL